MMKRIVNLITVDHIPISNFLVVTFTKASASDMKSRLISELEKQATDSFVLEQIDLVGTSDVTNLHSFCARLLKTYFYKVGLDPSFVILDENDMHDLEVRAMTKLFEECVNNVDVEMLLLADILNKKRSEKGLSEVILELKAFCETQTNFDEWVNNCVENCYNVDLENNICVKILNALAVKIFAKYRKKYENLAVLSKSVGDFALFEYLTSRLEMCGAVSENASALSNFEWLNNLPKTKRMPSHVKGEAEFIKAEAEAIKKSFDGEIKALKEMWGSDSVEDLKERLVVNRSRVLSIIRLTKRFMEILDSEKKAAGGVDFNDLEQLALKLLDIDEVCSALKERYKYVFVDEYQDINPVQEEIISRISAIDNKFMVGDIKQSIYRFRHCDPEIFLAKLNSYQEDPRLGDLVFLKENFRSNPNILAFANSLFSRIFTSGFGGINYDPDGLLVSGLGEWKTLNEKNIVSLNIIKKSKVTDKDAQSDLSYYSVLNHPQTYNEEQVMAEREAMVVAEKIRELNETRVCDFEGKNPKLLRLKDMVVLLSSRGTYLEKFASALNKLGIPTSSDYTEDVFEDEYVLMLLNLLKIINNFEDDYALFITLTSKFYNFTPQELAQIKIANPKTDNFATAFKLSRDNAPSGLKEKVIKTLDQIERFRTLSKFKTASDLVSIIIRETDFDISVLSSDNSMMHKTYFDRFVTSIGREPLTKFLDEIDSRRITCESASEGNAVKIMTIHASKGLEFPVVFLVNCSKGFSTQDERADLIISKDLGLGLRYYNEEKRYKGESFVRSAARIVEAEKTKEEQLRLLYVAITRAINYLVIVETADDSSLSKITPANEAKSFADWLTPTIMDAKCGANYSVEVNELNSDDLVMPNDETRFGGQVIFSNVNESEVSAIRSEVSAKRFDEALLKFPQKSTVTKLNGNEMADAPVLFKEEAGFSSDLGSAYHKLLEVIDFACPKSVEETKSRLVSEGKISAAIASEIDDGKIKRLLLSNDFQNLLSGGKVLKEKEFIMALNPMNNQCEKCDNFTVVQGVVDLVIIRNNSIIIVDYKLTNRSAQSIISAYKTQLELYAKAMSSALGLPVSEAYIIKLTTSQLIKVL